MENVVKVVNRIINWLWNRENVTLLIAIAGFGMSLYNFFRALWDKRCSFRVDYVSHALYEIKLDLREKRNNGYFKNHR